MISSKIRDVKIKTAMLTSIALVLLSGVVFGLNHHLNQKGTNLKVLSPVSHSFSILSFNSKREPPKKIIYGYLPYWTINKAKYLQYDKLTHIAYFGLHIDEKGNFLKYQDGETVPGYNNWYNNKDLPVIIQNAKNYNVQFALTVISHVDNVSDKFLDCRECWNTLANNIIQELIKKDIKDVNLNFEYAQLTPKNKAKQYTEFVDFLNKRLEAVLGESTLTVSTFADSVVKDRVTEIEGLGKVADLIFIMGYDFHRPTSDTSGPVAPIGGKGVHAEYDLQTMLQDYLTVVPPNKIVLGVPYYGYNWVVEKDEEYAKRVNGQDDRGYSQSQTYESIMETVITIKPDIKWDDLAKSPYFTYISPDTGSIRSVYYDDVDSLRAKYDLVNKLDLAGAGIWALGYDGGYEELWRLLKEEFID